MLYPFRPKVIFAFVLAFGSLCAVAAADDRFVGGMEGVPLMMSLTEIPEERVELDSPTGRIVQAAASGGASKAEVLEFYTDMLAKLGWHPEGAGVYRRNGKTLAIELEESISPGITVRFALFPDEKTKVP